MYMVVVQINKCVNAEVILTKGYQMIYGNVPINDRYAYGTVRGNENHDTILYTIVYVVDLPDFIKS